MDLSGLLYITLDKFCPKRLFEVELLAELTPQCGEFLDELIYENKKYENFTSVYFIVYPDLIKLLKKIVETKGEEINCYPGIMTNIVKTIASELLMKTNNGEITPIGHDLAVMVKLKIIEIMYVQYLAGVELVNKRKALEQELDALTKDTGDGKKGGKKGGKAEPGPKKSNKSIPVQARKSAIVTPIVSGLPQLPLEENDIIYDYNIDNHVMIFALCGFKDIYLIEELFTIRVPVSAIVEINSQSYFPEVCDLFIYKMKALIDEPLGNEYLNNTILMKYYKESNNNEIKGNLEELVYILKNVTFIKRQHLAYIKSLKLSDFGEMKDPIIAKCLRKYTYILDNYPAELVTIPLIIDALLEQICWIENGQIYTWTDLSTNPSHEDFSGSKKTFQIHQMDRLGMLVKTYKEKGVQIYENTIKMLRLMKVAQRDLPSNPIKLRSVGAPSWEYYPKHEKLHDYLHLLSFNEQSNVSSNPEVPQVYSFNENLILFNEIDEYKNALAQMSEQQFYHPSFTNKILNSYHMKEDLSEAVTLQLLQKAADEFALWKKTFCDETQSYLIRFFNNTNSFGLATQCWSQDLPTVVCLKDFCKYVTGKERQWIEKSNLVKSSEIVKKMNETCDGLTYLRDSELYAEYSYLLQTSSSTTTNNSEEVKKHQESFDGIINELKTYPSCESLHKICHGIESEFIGKMVYDLGPKQIQLTGKTQIIQSLDNIKITIDTARFMHEVPRVSVCVEAEGNKAYYHSMDPYTYHIILNDDTLIFIAEFVQIKRKDSMSVKSDSTVSSKISLSTSSSLTESIQLSHKDEETSKTIIRNINGGISRNINIDEFLEKYQLSSTTNNIHTLHRALPAVLLAKLESALEKHRKIYKISKRPNKFKHFKRNSSSIKVPLTRLIKRILFVPPFEKRTQENSFCYGFNFRKVEQEEKWLLRIVLPNGLYIQSVPGRTHVLELEQSYKWSHRSEKSRSFYYNGNIVVQNSDGSTTIMTSNGDLISLSNNEDESCNHDCMKDLPKMRNMGPDECLYMPSRFHNVYNDIKKLRPLEHFGNIPYIRKNILEFDGCSTTEINGKVTTQQLYYVVYDNDLGVEERLYERDDGFRCLIKRDGSKVVQFPDFTKIISWYVVEKEYIRVDPKADTWVSVIHCYRFEHPDYLSFMYDDEYNTEIFLNEVSIKCTKGDCFLCIKDLAIKTNGDGMSFLKSCKNCASTCFCYLNITQSEPLLEMLDSYGRTYKCDRKGNVTLNVNVTEQGTRVLKHPCCHLVRNEHFFQQLFVLHNSSGSYGSLWWSDGYVDDVTEGKTPNMVVKEYFNTLKEKQTIEVYFNAYQHFIERFLPSDSCRKPIELSKCKNKPVIKPEVFYVMYRILYLCNNAAEYWDVQRRLTKYLDAVQVGNDMLSIRIEDLLNFMKNYDEVQKIGFKMRKIVSANVAKKQDTVTPRPFVVPRTLEFVLEEWRRKRDKYRKLIQNRAFPCYFDSDYYQTVLAQIEQNKKT